jgi:hypothetical protein
MRVYVFIGLALCGALLSGCGGAGDAISTGTPSAESPPTFGHPTTYPTPSPRSLAVGDLNADSKPELVIAGENTVSVFDNRGNGIFRRGATIQWALRPSRSAT